MEDRRMLAVGSNLIADADLPQTVDYFEGIVLNDLVYFYGKPEWHDAGNEFWRFDPAANEGDGQFDLIADIHVGAGSSNISEWTILNGKIYFRAEDDVNSSHIFRYDPEANAGVGELTVVDSLAELADTAAEFTVFNERLYFSASDTDHGQEMWEFDPTANNGVGAARLVADIYPGSPNASPSHFVEMNGRLYFTAYNNRTGTELYEFDPAANGGAGEVTMTADLFPGEQLNWSIFYSRIALLPIDGVAYFVADQGLGKENEVWKWDPAANDGAGAATLVTSQTRIREWIAFDGMIYFSRFSDGAVVRFDPAAQDGSGEFTVVGVNPDDAYNFNASNFEVYDGVLYFQGDVGARGGLWQIDPASNDGLVTSLHTFHSADGPLAILKAGETLYFRTADVYRDLLSFDLVGDQGVQVITDITRKRWVPFIPVITLEGKLYYVETGNSRYRLWQHDPEAADGQDAIRVVAHFEGGYVLEGRPSIVSLDGELYFQVRFQSSSDETWRYNPATDSLTLVPDLKPSSDGMIVVDGKIYLGRAFEGVGSELWSYIPGNEGQPGLSHLEADLNPGTSNSSPKHYQLWNDKLYFSALTPNYGYEPIEFDLATSEFRVLANLKAGSSGSDPQDFIPLGDKLYFHASLALRESRLYVYDPNGNDGAGSVSLVSDEFSFGKMATLDGKLYYYGGDNVNTRELREYDPNANNGAGQISKPTEVHSGFTATSVESVAAYNGKLYFQATFAPAMTGGQSVGNKLWSFDPATGDIQLVPGNLSTPTDFLVADDTLFVIASPPAYNQALVAYQDNFPPSAYNDHYDVLEDVPLSIPANGVLANDDSPNHDPLAASLINGPSHGQLTLSGDGSFTYTPDTDYFGSDSFTYEAREPDGEVSQAVVTFAIAPINDLATIEGTLTGSTNEDDAVAVTGQLTITDTDPGEEQFQPQVDTAGQYGRFSLTAGGSWTYVLDTSTVQHLGDMESTEDTFVVTSLDGSASETIVISIAGIDDAPSIIGDITATTNEDATETLAGTLAYIDPDSPSSPFIPLTHVTYLDGVFRIDAAGNWTFDAHPIVNRLAAGTTAVLEYPVSTMDGTTEMVRITIEGRDDSPYLSSALASTHEDDATLLTGQVLILDVDLDAATQFTEQINTEGSYGLFSIDTIGNWSYTLLPERVQFLTIDETASDSFAILDATGTIVDQFTILIEGSNDSPQAIILPIREVRQVGTELVFEAAGSDPESQFQDLNARWEVYETANGNPILLQFLNIADAFRFAPDRTGRYEIRLTLIDEGGAEGQAARTIQIGVPSQVSLNFAESGATAAGTTDSTSSTEDKHFHEWQDVPLQLWMTVDQDVLSAPFNFQWEVSVNHELFGETQTVTQLGSHSTWELTSQSEGWLLSGHHASLDLSQHTLGDRVLLATIWLPRNLENMAGVSMQTQGAYPEAIAVDGIELRSASLIEVAEHPFSIIAGNQVTIAPVIYDANDDGQIGVRDFASFISNYGKRPEVATDAYRFDYNRDGKIGLTDFALFISNYGRKKSQAGVQISQPSSLFEAISAKPSLPLEQEAINLATDQAIASLDKRIYLGIELDHHQNSRDIIDHSSHEVLVESDTQLDASTLAYGDLNSGYVDVAVLEADLIEHDTLTDDDFDANLSASDWDFEIAN